MKSYLVDVTEEDIANGKVADPNSCPVALAIQRVVPGNPEILVTRNEVTFIYPDTKKFFIWFKAGKILMRPLPKFVGRFIVNFDTYNDTKPFSFELEV